MPGTERLRRSKQWRHLLLAVILIVFYPTCVSSSTRSTPTTTSRPIDQTQQRPKLWGVIPKIETSFKIDFGTNRRSNAAVSTAFPKRMIVMGGPASGKGTQCQDIVAKHGLVHLSTGDMLRQAVSSKSSVDSETAPYISTIKKCMEQGKLIPDEIIVRLVLDRLRDSECQERGWILNGFPRTSNQARALQNAGIAPDVFLFLDVPDEVAIKRACGRRTDPLTGKVYHLDWNPPPNDEIQERLVQRSDDTVESMKQRLRQFRENANAVKCCYNNVVEIDGLGTPQDVRNEINSSLKRFSRGKVSPL
ncbi:hypothetical protein ACHAXR_009583 [Thalassiosira sp. AJA248-18]